MWSNKHNRIFNTKQVLFVSVESSHCEKVIITVSGAAVCKCMCALCIHNTTFWLDVEYITSVTGCASLFKWAKMTHSNTNAFVLFAIVSSVDCLTVAYGTMEKS